MNNPSRLRLARLVPLVLLALALVIYVSQFAQSMTTAGWMPNQFTSLAHVLLTVSALWIAVLALHASRKRAQR